jgi:hypothetical protein
MLVLTVLLAPVWALLEVGCLLLAATAARAALGQLQAQRHVPYLSPFRALIVTVAVLASLGIGFWIRDAAGDVSGLAAWLLGPQWLGLFILIGFAVMFGLIARDMLRTRQVVRGQLRRSVFSANTAPADTVQQPWIKPRLAAIARAASGNVSVYSGYEPFTGFGVPVDGWSFALPILPAAEGLSGAGGRREIVPFTTPELVTFVQSRLQALAGAGEDRLDALILEQRVFVNGGALITDAQFAGPDGADGQDGAPRLTPAEIERIALHPRGAGRLYLCAHLPSWGGELMASTFLHMSTAGEVLYLRCDRRVLGPIAAAYHEVDRMTETMTEGQFRRLLAEATAQFPGMVFGAPRRAVHRALLGWRHDRRLIRDAACAAEDMTFDSGARISIRELAVDPRYQNFFQAADVDKHLSIVTRHVLAAILDFLDDHGVDTTEFRDQQMMVLNQGIIQSGGLSVVGAQAVGAGAQAAQGQPAERRSRDGGR